MRPHHPALRALAALSLTALLLLAGCAGGQGHEPSGAASSAVQSNVASSSGSSSSGSSSSGSSPSGSSSSEVSSPSDGETVLTVSIGDTQLSASLADTDAALALVEFLRNGPVTLELHDYGSFEKTGDLGTELPRSDTSVTTQPGDLILYQGNQFCLYYGVNTWDFTRLGYLNDISAEELKELLGGGDISVTLSLTDSPEAP